MARSAGRNGRLYMGIAAGGTAEPIAFISKFAADMKTNQIKVTAFGDPNEVYVGGLPDATGTFDGYFDDATQQMYTAAIDGLARKMYAYENIVTQPSQYFFTTAIFGFHVEWSVDGSVDISGSWAATSPLNKVG